MAGLLHLENLHRVLLAGEGLLARQHLVERRADGVHVRVEVDRAGHLDLLGRHVVRGADEHAVVALERVLAGTDEDRGLEAGDLDRVVGLDDERAGLEVAEDKAGLLPGAVERVGELDDELRGAAGVERVVLAQDRGERLALEALQHGVGDAALAARDVDDLDEVTVVEAGEGARELLEARDGAGVLQRVHARRKERDLAVKGDLQRLPRLGRRGRGEVRRDVVAGNGGDGTPRFGSLAHAGDCTRTTPRGQGSFARCARDKFPVDGAGRRDIESRAFSAARAARRTQTSTPNP